MVIARSGLGLRPPSPWLVESGEVVDAEADAGAMEDR